MHAHSRSAAGAGEGRLRFVLLLTATLLGVEIAGGLLTNSLALLSDAGHMVADVAGLALALAAIRFGRRPASPQQTYGFYRIETLAAFVNGLLLLGIAAYILFEAAQRFTDPPDIEALPVLGVAAAGLLVNLLAAYLLSETQKTSLNLRGAYLEVLSDLLGSIAVIVSAAIVLATGFDLADPLVSVLIGLFILPRAWRFAGEAVHVLLEGAPRGLELDHIREHILGTEGVVSLHDLHVWNLTSGMNVMSAHVVISEDASAQTVLDEVCLCLDDHFDIEHSTIQIEQPDRSASELSSH